ncbi:glycerate kinase [Leifsonia xyli]|uniref:glycerate kinase n=1 Tax=Leifsonia xyli TaxID=1575 RepID=UPI003D6663ED
MDLRVVIAPDSFKGSADADAVSRAIAEGWSAVRPADHVRRLPMADGGEGTVDAFLASAPGAAGRSTAVEGPDGRPVSARWALLPPTGSDGGPTAVLEIAQTSGLGLMHPLRPLDGHTRGLGRLIVAALDAGATRILIGLGGSATSDGGSGALQEIGARLTDERGGPIPPGNAGLASLAHVDLTALRRTPEDGVTLLTDVRSPLLGERGAARMFGPQKGASPAEVETLERNLTRFVRCVATRRPDADAVSVRPGAGAAGGTGFGLALWGADFRAGAQEVAARLGLPAAIREADLVITGEGRFDEQTREGKVAAEVASLASAAGTPVLLVAGSIAADPAGFADQVELSSLAGSVEASVADTVRWARRAGEVLAARRPG